MSRAFYDRISHVYDAIADASEHEAREHGLAALAVQAGERVLEIGYGTGHAVVQIAESVGKEGRVVGVDISEGMRAVAQARTAEAEVGRRVELLVEEVPPLPLPDGRFDAAFLSFTLELFDAETIPPVLAEVRRVLRPGGRLGVVSMATTPSGDRESVLTHTYRWMHRHFPHIVDCQPIDAAALLTAAGFEITYQESMQIWTLPVAVVVGHTLATS